MTVVIHGTSAHIRTTDTYQTPTHPTQKTLIQLSILRTLKEILIKVAADTGKAGSVKRFNYSESERFKDVMKPFRHQYIFSTHQNVHFLKIKRFR